MFRQGQKSAVASMLAKVVEALDRSWLWSLNVRESDSLLDFGADWTFQHDEEYSEWAP